MSAEAETFAVSLAVAGIIREAIEIPIGEVEAWAAVARRERERHDTLTAIMDPSAWMRDQRGVSAMAKVAAAFLEFRRVVEENRAAD